MLIPEANDIRPCERPKDYVTNQLAYYPTKLKKLPEWVDNASFYSNEHFQNQQQKNINLNFLSSLQKQPFSPQIQEGGDFSTSISSKRQKILHSLSEKYKKQQFYQLLYERDCPQTFDLTFLKQFVSNDFRQLEKYQQKQSKYQNIFNLSLKFDSKFQSGNLQKAYRLKQPQYWYKKIPFTNQIMSQTLEQYHLIMQKDTNTQGYTQWYCFSINNTQNEDKPILIKIVNFVKSKSLYKSGMKPWIISQKNPIWKRNEEECKYQKTNVQNQFGENLYELSFKTIAKPGLSFFSMMPTYTYTKLCEKIKQWVKHPGMNKYYKNVYTVMNNIMPILQYIPQNKLQNQMPKEEKKWLDTIILTARVHPGQVWSSYFMEELVQSIIKYHRKNNTIKIRYLIVPMLNPDGVIYGNFRCDFTGVDCNRVWQDTNKYYQPAIYQLKKIFNNQLQKKKAKFHFDLHSHSKRHNIFAYICSENVFQGRILPDLIRLNKQNKIFDPVKESQINFKFFNQSQCTYISGKQIFQTKKGSTIRAFMSQITFKQNSITIQISFHGYKSKQNQIKNFQKDDFSLTSQILVERLIQYINDSQNIEITRKMIKSIYQLYEKSSVCGSSIGSKKNNGGNGNGTLSLQNMKGGLGDDDSDSEPQKYYDPQSEVNLKVVKNYKKLKTYLSQKNKLSNQQPIIKKTQQNINEDQQTKNDNKSPTRRRNKTLHTKSCSCDDNKSNKIILIKTNNNHRLANGTNLFNQQMIKVQKQGQRKTIQNYHQDSDISLIFQTRQSKKMIKKQFDIFHRNYFKPSNKLKRQQNITSELFQQRQQKRIQFGRKIPYSKQYYVSSVRQIKSTRQKIKSNKQKEFQYQPNHKNKQVIIKIDNSQRQDQNFNTLKKQQLIMKQYRYKYELEQRQSPERLMSRIMNRSNSKSKEFNTKQGSEKRQIKRLMNDGEKLLEMMNKETRIRVFQKDKNKQPEKQLNIEQIMSKRKKRINTEINQESSFYDFSDKKIFKKKVQVSYPLQHNKNPIINVPSIQQTYQDFQTNPIFDNKKFKNRKILNLSYIITPKMNSNKKQQIQ